MLGQRVGHSSPLSLGGDEVKQGRGRERLANGAEQSELLNTNKRRDESRLLEKDASSMYVEEEGSSIVKRRAMI